MKEHFKILLGNSPKITDKTTEKSINSQLDIKPWQFTSKELDATLKKNTPTQIEFLLHSQEQAAGGINFYVKTDKTEFFCIKQEIYVNICIGNTWAATDTLSSIWKSGLSHKIKRDFWLCQYYCMDAPPELLIGTVLECNMLFWTNPGSNTSQNCNCITPYFPSHSHTSKKTCMALLEK